MEGYEGNGKPRKDFRHAPLNAIVDNWKTLDLTNRDFRVFVTLWRKSLFINNRLAKVTQEQLADDMAMPVSSLNASLDRLVRVGLIERRRGGKSRASEYQLCSLSRQPKTTKEDGIQFPQDNLF